MLLLQDEFGIRKNISQKEFLGILYQKKGKALPSLLEGDFAFVLEQGETYFCARDHLGIASFYYAFDGDTFLSADSLGALLEQLSFRPKADRISMRDFAWHNAMAPERTMYEGIFRLPPGHYMTINHKHVFVRRYWNPASIKTDYSISFDDAKKHFVSLFTKAVTERIPKDKPVACELSGGFDSSSILCIAQKYHSDIIPFSMYCKDDTCNENCYIKSVLEHTGLKGYGAYCDGLDFSSQYNMEFNYNLTPHWPIWISHTMKAPMFELIKTKGIKTVLTGQMGDQILWQNNNLVWDLPKRFKFIRLWQELSFYIKQKETIRDKIVILLPPNVKEWIKFLLGKKKRKSKSLKSRSYQNYIEDKRFSSDSQRFMIGSLTSGLHCMYVDSNFGKAIQEKYGIISRHPFADIRLVEFMFALPPEYKYRLGNHRFFHAESLKDILPHEVLNRKDKADFSVPVLQQISAINRESLWQNPSIVKLKIVEWKDIKRLEEIYQNKKLKGYNLQRYWRFINLEYWYNSNTFINKAGNAGRVSS